MTWGQAVAVEPRSEAIPAAGADRYRPPPYEWPPFANWDCVGTKGTADWDALYAEVDAGLRRGRQAGDPFELPFVLPDAAFPLLHNKFEKVFEECPMGTLYFLALYTYSFIMSVGGEAANEQSAGFAAALRKFPFFVIAGARWPTFEALHHFSALHEPLSTKAQETSKCYGRGAGVDWDALLGASQRWSEEQTMGLEPGEGDAAHGMLLKDAADKIYKDPQGAGSLAQDECPFGFVFLCTTQVLAAAARLTGAFEPWCRALDRMLAELPFFSIAGSSWPTFFVLAMFSSLSKGGQVPVLRGFQDDVHRWGGAHPQSKRFRQYGDLRLLDKELSPLGTGKAGWRSVDLLVPLPYESWYATLEVNAAPDLRAVAVDALDAAVRVVRASTFLDRRECGFSGISEEQCLSRECTWHADAPESSPRCQRKVPARKLVGVTFVWGKKWAALVPKFLAWAYRLGLGVIVVAMGEACRSACEAGNEALGGAGASGLACWDPLRSASDAKGAEHGSILQRHAIVHILLHLGIDVIAFDFDTFFFQDPRSRLEEIAAQEEADVLMTRHLDADCLNMGLLYVRASSRTAEWYSRYLAWLHQHPFEREQRGANALLGFTKQSVSFPPKGLPEVRAASLDDANEFASSRGGWLGDWSKLHFFHWVNPRETYSHWGDVKIGDLHALYEVALHPGVKLPSAGWSLARLLGNAPQGSSLVKVRELLETMKTPQLPERLLCW